MSLNGRNDYKVIRVLSSISNKYLLLMIVACLVGSLTSTIAYSQELPSDASTWGAARFPTAWWSPENAQSETAPQLVMSMTAPTDLKASDSIRTAGAQPNSDRQTEATEAAIAGFPHFGLMDGSFVKPNLLTDRVSLAPTSAFLQSEYSTWESSLANSRSLSGVNGVPVYPLLQVSCGGWQLPVTLYTSSLRHGDAR
jgi:hypothetical protein